MASTAAVAYCASDGYLFETFTSALQARRLVAADVRVVIVHVESGQSEEGRRFRAVCDAEGIEFIGRDPRVLEGLPFYYARVFLDRLLPDGIDDVLYLDGDTQVLRSLMPLLLASPPPGGLLAACDPMVLYAQAIPAFRRMLEQRWSSSGIPEPTRGRYVNAGVLRLRVSDVPSIRQQVLAARSARGGDSAFAEQDLLNLVLPDRIVTVSPEWNFPGFLIGTRIEGAVAPRIVHFMSDPRPWWAALRPWAEYHTAYLEVAAAHPGLARYRRRASALERFRYRLQTGYKGVTETRYWRRRGAQRYSWVHEYDRAIESAGVLGPGDGAGASGEARAD